MKRASKTKLDVLRPPAHLHFSDEIGQRGVSVYVKKLSEALNMSGAVQIMANDGYMRHQLRKAAGTLKLKLVYALEGEFLYVKPLAIEGELKRLMLYLREARTLNELMAYKLELHLTNSLADLAKKGLAHAITKGTIERWVLTEKGMEAI